MSEPEPAEYSLVMPFVVCQSEGGPYDDDSFVAGFQAGRLDQALASLQAVGGTGLKVTISAGLNLQLDLIAMARGFTVTTEPTGVEGWLYAEFEALR